MDSEILGGILVIAGYFATILLMARRKNRRVWVWLLAGVVFPLLSLIILMFAYPLAKDGEHDSGVA
jgi:uncharacterized membrane protein HdeD (DUF308 family)